MKCYLHDGIEGDQRETHDSGIPVDPEELERIGVIALTIDNVDHVKAIAEERGYTNHDNICITEDGLGGKILYQEKLKSFYEEHLHEDEEIRYIQDGEGFFDVRDTEDQWLRVLLEKNDLLILPAGIYHRFTPTRQDYVKALRLFQDEPKWDAKKRPEGDCLPIRNMYLLTIE